MHYLEKKSGHSSPSHSDSGHAHVGATDQHGNVQFWHGRHGCRSEPESPVKLAPKSVTGHGIMIMFVQLVVRVESRVTRVTVTSHVTKNNITHKQIRLEH